MVVDEEVDRIGRSVLRRRRVVGRVVLVGLLGRGRQPLGNCFFDRSPFGWALLLGVFLAVTVSGLQVRDQIDARQHDNGNAENPREDVLAHVKLLSSW